MVTFLFSSYSLRMVLLQAENCIKKFSRYTQHLSYHLYLLFKLVYFGSEIRSQYKSCPF